MLLRNVADAKDRLHQQATAQLSEEVADLRALVHALAQRVERQQHQQHQGPNSAGAGQLQQQPWQKQQR